MWTSQKPGPIWKNSLGTHSSRTKDVVLTDSLTRSRLIDSFILTTHKKFQEFDSCDCTSDWEKRLGVYKSGRSTFLLFDSCDWLGSSLKYGTNKVLRFAHRSPTAWRVTGGAPKVKAGNFKFFVVESRSSAFRAQQTRESAVPVIACLARLK